MLFEEKNTNILNLGIKADYIYHFGSPRVGDENFANFFNKNYEYSYRITHGNDLVPHLVLRAVGFY